MTAICPECGGSLEQWATCQEIFDSFLVLEFTDPRYGEVHFLTVACFMIQHGRYGDEALAWIGQKLQAYLEDGIPIDQIRRQAGKEARQSKRAWKMMRQPDAPPLPKITWCMTIGDVAARYHDAASYCDLVRQWARCTLREMKPLL